MEQTPDTPLITTPLDAAAQVYLRPLEQHLVQRKGADAEGAGPVVLLVLSCSVTLGKKGTLFAADHL